MIDGLREFFQRASELVEPETSRIKIFFSDVGRSFDKSPEAFAGELSVTIRIAEQTVTITFNLWLALSMVEL